MARLLAKSTFVLLTLGFCVLSSSASSAKEDKLDALNQQIVELLGQGKYQEAIPLAEKAVEITRRLRGPEGTKTANSLNNLDWLARDRSRSRR